MALSNVLHLSMIVRLLVPQSRAVGGDETRPRYLQSPPQSAKWPDVLKGIDTVFL